VNENKNVVAITHLINKVLINPLGKSPIIKVRSTLLIKFRSRLLSSIKFQIGTYEIVLGFLERGRLSDADDDDDGNVIVSLCAVAGNG